MRTFIYLISRKNTIQNVVEKKWVLLLTNPMRN